MTRDTQAIQNAPAPPEPQPENNAATDNTAALIEAVWQRSLPTVHQRLDLLDRAAAAASPMDPELRAQATGIAHKLAGSLGMFGHHHATQIAREIELHLEATDTQAAHLATLTIRLRRTLFPPAPATT